MKVAPKEGFFETRGARTAKYTARGVIAWDGVHRVQSDGVFTRSSMNFLVFSFNV